MLKLRYIISSTIKDYDASQINCAYFSKRFDEYKQQQNKLNVFCEYVLLKQLLNSVNQNLDTQIITTTPQGKPKFENSSLYFSISHSKNIVAVAIANKPIGLDVQATTNANLKISQRYFTPKVHATITNSRNADWLFTKNWAQYESQLKLFGSRAKLLENKNKIHSKFKTITDTHKNKYCLCISG